MKAIPFKLWADFVQFSRIWGFFYIFLRYAALRQFTLLLDLRVQLT